MDRLFKAGRYNFPLSFLLYVALHLGKPDAGAAFVPDYIPFPYFWNYFTLVCILLFILSAVIGKYDKLAYCSMAVYVILMAFLMHLPRAMGHELDTQAMASDLAREKELEAVNFFRNIMISGALLGFAGYIAKDSRLAGCTRVIFTPFSPGGYNIRRRPYFPEGPEILSGSDLCFLPVNQVYCN